MEGGGSLGKGTSSNKAQRRDRHVISRRKSEGAPEAGAPSMGKRWRGRGKEQTLNSRVKSVKCTPEVRGAH